MEVFPIKISIRSEKKDVLKFLEDLQLIINDSDFDIDKNLTLIINKKPKEKIMFSTPYTLLDLLYETNDIVERLQELTIYEY